MTSRVRHSMVVTLIVAIGASFLLASCSQIGVLDDANSTQQGSPVDPAADGRFKAALKLMKNGQPQDAQKAFLAMASAYPGLSGPLTNLGILYSQGKQGQQAIAVLSSAVKMNPDNVVAWNWLGILYRENGNFARSEQCYLSAIKVSPKYAAAHLNLGILYDVSMHRPQDAIIQYREYQKVTDSQNLMVTVWIKELENPMLGNTTSNSRADQ